MPMPINTTGAIIIPVTAISRIAITIIMAIITAKIPISINMDMIIDIIPIIGKRFVMTIGHMGGTINILMDIGTLVKMKNQIRH